MTMTAPDQAIEMDATQQRLTDLEIKASFTEDLIERLDLVIIRQQQQIDQLTRELADLRSEGTSAPAGKFKSLRDEAPPHY